MLAFFSWVLFEMTPTDFGTSLGIFSEKIDLNPEVTEQTDQLEISINSFRDMVLQTVRVLNQQDLCEALLPAH